ncbi:DUF3576 domain-containing protein [Nereida sp. MMG025]|uniref:DUF3576 domain-containing protein n=1 Tax=Nereida sp. MMG025 TaxID=2909981 RepID=UPI001F2C96CA|nr:DUF3576 domain-containing protein [Nereida sp. MMG025]MCF6444779.1 DUF3576 domain-containing protein [Nereida sp. MMG025]
MLKYSLFAGVAFALSACGTFSDIRDPNNAADEDAIPDGFIEERESTIWDLFQNNDDPNVTVEVNKYLWNASLDVLNFLPIQGADPFTGLIVTGFGTPPGGSRAYRATIFIRDPALDARSINVSLQTRSGPADVDTVRAIEDAIMTRARQLRIADSRL